MVAFDLWGESFIFALVYSVIILIPCVIVGFLGRRMITRIGTYPTQTPAIQMSVFFVLVVTEVITFFCLIGFYQFFTS